MYSRQLVAAVTVCLGLSLGFGYQAMAQDEAPQPTALELFEQGRAELEAGRVEEARQLLRRLDPEQLPPDVRREYFRTLPRLDGQTLDENGEAAEVGTEASEPAVTVEVQTDEVPAEVEAPPTPAELIAQADDLAGREPSQAAVLYQQVIADEQADAATRAAAQAKLAQLRRSMQTDLTWARRQIDLATADIEAGRIDEAGQRLNRVQQSGVSLGWFDQQRLGRQLAVVAERTAPVVTAQAVPEVEVETETDATTEADVPAVAEVDEPAAPAPVGTSEPAAVVADQPAAAVVEQPAATPAAEPVETAAVQSAPPVDSDMLSQYRLLRAQQRGVEAQQAEEAGQIDVAIRRYQQAQQLDPANRQYATRLAALQAQVEMQDAPRSVLEEQLGQRAINEARTIAEFEYRMSQARQRLEAGDFPAARDFVSQAKVGLDNNQSYLASARYRELRGQAEALDTQITQWQNQAEAARIEQAGREQAYEQYEARRAARRRDMEQVNDLLTRALERRMDMDYERALELVDEALFLDPTNPAAQAMKMGINDSWVAVRARNNLEIRRQNIAGQRADNIEATIPYTGIIQYPDSWPELSQKRWDQLDTAGADSEVNRRTLRQLRESYPIDFEGHRLVNVIDYFRTTTNANFFVNWQALQMVGVDQDTPISLQLRNVPAEQALRLVLQQATSTSQIEPVSYAIVDGIVTISTQSDLQRTTDTRVYDIRDLLVQVPNFESAPSFDLTEVLDSSGSGSGSGSGRSGGSSGGSLFGDSSNDRDSQDDMPSRADLILEISTLIRDTVGNYDEWVENGGTISSLRELNGNLIVRTTTSNHNQLVDLLDQLRETRAIQISVEARFLLVDQNFLEHVGVDLDVNITGIGSGFSNIGVAQDSANIAGPVPSVMTPTQFDSVGGIGAPGVFTPGFGFPSTGRSLDLGVTYLDDLEVNLLVTATQASQRSISLTAPRVTFFNGQRANVVISRQFAFVSDLEPVPDAVGGDPTVSVVQSGVVLDVQGTVSADRRYVTMTLLPSLATVAEISTFQVFGDIDRGDDDDDDAPPLLPIFSAGFIQLPELEITTVQATVSVPDQGTLLLGGQRMVEETEIEAGVPVLSKLPFLNRLFTNTSTVQDERTLLILVKPTIIILSEQEEDLFPNMPTNPSGNGQMGLSF